MLEEGCHWVGCFEASGDQLGPVGHCSFLLSKDPELKAPLQHHVCLHSAVFLVKVSIPVTKYHGQKVSWRGKGLFALGFPCSSLEEGRTGTQAGQEPGGGS